MKSLLCLFLSCNLLYGKTYNISLEGMKFIPDTVTTKVGDKVKFINNSPFLHNVISLKSGIKSGMLRKGDTFTIEIKKQETINYYCEPHKSMGMKGIIYVK